ncbi:DUF4176 domain-containing protein [Limosilactobacillus equigenerosi]|uniref:DUF4176 domain-containing protein n=1 Tax=Limosilactobacillus equigenerosi DSM 18793 = JCM 14505 TaxID=1423742 RepID=A0A0R1UGL4_9LACO|nr:DUF4176 domain-containing protein [Limosilactobacillus equigenerosi]KRL92519.1 hypothetical protein FC21_GL000239 [Limosilactobacillus equigenerosi DSM 18793 = JCM 14505]
MLSIGSIVYLEGGDQKLMIIGQGQIMEQNKQQVYFDYVACQYPSGIDPEEVYYFNKEDIAEVVFDGYRDEESYKVDQLYQEWIEKTDLPKGETSL